MVVLDVVELAKLAATWYKSRNSHVFISILSPALHDGAHLTLTETAALAEPGSVQHHAPALGKPAARSSFQQVYHMAAVRNEVTFP